MAIRGVLKDTLGIREVDKHDRYIGLPTTVGRSKKVIFDQQVKERIWKDLKGWKEKTLSRAGKEILIKAINSRHTHLHDVLLPPACRTLRGN